MAEDLSPFFGDPLFTVPVVFGATTTTGILDQSSIDLGGGVVQSNDYNLLMKASDFASEPTPGSAITVDGVAYTINRYSPIDDGKIVQLRLAKT